jgi:hypothetical protein
MDFSLRPLCTRQRLISLTLGTGLRARHTFPALARTGIPRSIIDVRAGGAGRRMYRIRGDEAWQHLSPKSLRETRLACNGCLEARDLSLSVVAPVKTRKAAPKGGFHKTP